MWNSDGRPRDVVLRVALLLRQGLAAEAVVHGREQQGHVGADALDGVGAALLDVGVLAAGGPMVAAEALPGFVEDEEGGKLEAVFQDLVADVEDAFVVDLGVEAGRVVGLVIDRGERDVLEVLPGDAQGGELGLEVRLADPDDGAGRATATPSLPDRLRIRSWRLGADWPVCGSERKNG